MIKNLLIYFIIITCMVAGLLSVNADIDDLKIKTKRLTTSGNQMDFEFQIENNSGASVNYSDIEVYYYFTLDDEKPFTLSSDDTYAEVIYHKSRIPQLFAMDIIEVNFDSAKGSLSNSSTSSAVKVTITDGVATRDNDYSYDPDGSTSSYEYNRNLTAVLNGEVVWGPAMNNTGLEVYVEGGWFDDVSPSDDLTVTKNSRYDDDNRFYITNDSSGSKKVVFDFKDISTKINYGDIEKMTLTIVHFEDSGAFDADDLDLDIGTGLKPSETADVWGTTYMTPINGSSNEGTFSWDVTSYIGSIADVNDMQVKLSFNTTQSNTVYIDRIYLDIDYTWDGEHSSSPVDIDSDGTYVNLKYGPVWISFPSGAGSVEISSRRGIDLGVDDLGDPTATFPDRGPFYSLTYDVPASSSDVQLTRLAGDLVVFVKYTAD